MAVNIATVIPDAAIAATFAWAVEIMGNVRIVMDVTGAMGVMDVTVAMDAEIAAVGATAVVIKACLNLPCLRDL